MITDCGSFLAEYGATGHPLIHLWCLHNAEVPLESSQRLWNGFYRATNPEEMFSAFESVLERKDDPKREYRIRTIHELQLRGTNASANIIRYIRQLTGR